MLGTLLKQEAKSQGKTILGMYAALAAATLLVLGLFLIKKAAGGPMETIFVFGCGIYILTIVIVFIVNFVYLCFHFYQSMYSQQGYLTHTLPVKTTQILHVKIIVSFVYLFLTEIFSVLSFLGVGLITDGVSVSVMSNGIQKTLTQIADELGISVFILLFFVLLIMILGCLDALLLFFAGSSIGQLAHRSKGAFGIAAGIGLYYISQIVSVIVIMVGAFALFSGTKEIQPAPWAMGGFCLLLAGWAVVYYLMNRIIVQKHLNLE